jgi:hypothetical protein
LGVIATIRAKKRCDHGELLEKLRQIEGVTYLEEL